MHVYNNSNLRGDNMRVVKSLMLMAIGATAVLLYQRYGDQMMIMAEDMIKKHNCTCDGLEN